MTATTVVRNITTNQQQVQHTGLVTVTNNRSKNNNHNVKNIKIDDNKPWQYQSVENIVVNTTVKLTADSKHSWTDACQTKSRTPAGNVKYHLSLAVSPHCNIGNQTDSIEPRISDSDIKSQWQSPHLFSRLWIKKNALPSQASHCSPSSFIHQFFWLRESTMMQKKTSYWRNWNANKLWLGMVWFGESGWSLGNKRSFLTFDFFQYCPCNSLDLSIRSFSWWM